jgi:hypothetical protein
MKPKNLWMAGLCASVIALLGAPAGAVPGC